MKISKRFLSALVLLSITWFKATPAFSQKGMEEIPLYENGIPNEVPGPDEEKIERSVDQAKKTEIIRISNVKTPTLTVFLPPKGKANGTAVVICPGGGYARLASGHEGYDVAQKFVEQGVAAFVLKYRLPDAKITKDPETAPLQDAQQAILLVRKRAKEWQVNPERVGILGFSAGGHLASTAGTHFTKTTVENQTKLNLRPDFMMLIYPVISSDKEIAHMGSFENLLGKDATEAKRKEYSNELQVTPQTPPTFLVHASDDKGVKSENSIRFYQALLQNSVPAELHIYQKGGHGFGLVNSTTKDLWFERGINWLGTNGFLK